MTCPVLHEMCRPESHLAAESSDSVDGICRGLRRRRRGEERKEWQHDRIAQQRLKVSLPQLMDRAIRPLPMTC